MVGRLLRAFAETVENSCQGLCHMCLHCVDGVLPRSIQGCANEGVEDVEQKGGVPTMEVPENDGPHLSASSVNCESCGNVRAGVEESDKWEVGVVPSASSVEKAAKELETHAVEEHNLSIHEESNDHGVSHWFDLGLQMRLMTDGFRLSEHAVTGSTSPPAPLCHTLDGAQLTMHLGRVKAGVKVADPRATDPIAGLPLVLMQSRDPCFPSQIAFGGDCKDLCKDCFGAFHSHFNNGVVIPGVPELGLPEFGDFKVVSPQDLSSMCKCAGGVAPLAMENEQ